MSLPHDGAQAFTGDSVPPLRLMNGNALVCYAISMSSTHLLLLLLLLLFLSIQISEMLVLLET